MAFEFLVRCHGQFGEVLLLNSPKLSLSRTPYLPNKSKGPNLHHFIIQAALTVSAIQPDLFAGTEVHHESPAMSTLKTSAPHSTTTC